MNCGDTIDKFEIDVGDKLTVLGKTNSGKSTFLRRLIENRNFVFKEPVTRIIYIYRFYHDWFRELESIVEFRNKVPNDIKPEGQNLLIFDDALETMFNEISDWYLRSGRQIIE